MAGRRGAGEPERGLTGSSSSTVTRTPPVRSLMRWKSSAITTAGRPGEHEHDPTQPERLEDPLVLELEATHEPLTLGALPVLVGEGRPVSGSSSTGTVLDEAPVGASWSASPAIVRRWC